MKKLLLLLLLAAIPARAAITVAHSYSNCNTSANSCVTSSTTVASGTMTSTTTGNAVIVFVQWASTTSTVSLAATGGTVSFQVITGPITQAGNFRMEAWADCNITGGTTAITATQTGGGTQFFDIHVWEVSGQNNSSHTACFEGANSATSTTGGNTANSITCNVTVSSTDMLAGFLATGDTNTTHGTSPSAFVQVTNLDGNTSENFTVSGAGT